MERRRFLVTSGAVATVALAGCGSPGGDGGGPYDVESDRDEPERLAPQGES